MNIWGDGKRLALWSRVVQSRDVRYRDFCRTAIVTNMPRTSEYSTIQFRLKMPMALQSTVENRRKTSKS